MAALFNYAVRYYDLKDNPCRKAGSIGKSKGYFSTTRTRHPEYFQNVELKQVGDTIIISQEGIDEVLKHIKKEGDRLRILPLKVVYKAKKQGFCFYPQAIIIP